MRTADAVAFFGRKAALARALNISRTSVDKWGELVPPLRAVQLQKMTRGKLHFDPDSYVTVWNQSDRPKRRARK